MGIDLFLAELQELGISFRIIEGKLRASIPKGVMTPALKVRIGERRDEILTFLGRASLSAPTASIPRADRTQTLPLSHGQRRLWLLEQLEDAGAAYHMPAAYRLHGSLDTKALSWALAELERCHEILRTRIVLDDGQPCQVIEAAGSLELELVDVADLDASQHHELAQAFITQPFDLARGPLLRLILLRHNETDHQLLICLHHIIADAPSVGLFVRQLIQAYATRVPLSPPAVQYADYAVWQAERLAGADHARALQAWCDRLAGAPDLLDLPTDRVRPAQQRFAGAYLERQLDAELSAGLRVLAREGEATLFMTMLAAFGLLLARYSGQSEVVVGSPADGRDHSGLGETMGLFLNMLPLRVSLTDCQSFGELLARVRAEVLAAFDGAAVPFEMILEKLQPPRNLSHAPVFQVSLMQRGENEGEHEIPGLRLEPLPLHDATAKYDLSLGVLETREGLRFSLEYSTALFDAATMTTLADHFRNLLCEIVRDPAQDPARIPLLAEAERRQLLELGVGNYEGAALGSLPARLWTRVGDERPALYREDGTCLTYAELLARAEAIAAGLNRLGVHRGEVLPVGLPRGPRLLTCLLGVMRAGAAYVPLDPDYPAERIATILSDCGARRWITDTPQTGGPQPIHPDELTDDANCTVRYPHANELAYVIYTSGSTGRPKGVAVSHGALDNFLTSMLENPGLDTHDHLVAVTTVSFDIAALELYGPLLAGARLTIASRESAADGSRLLELLRRSQATVMQATPATWRLLLATGAPLPPIKILCGGEAFPAELAHQLLAVSDTVYNMYGPTETTIWSAVERVATAPESGSVPVGPPIARTDLYVLDRQIQPLPFGVAGELLIAGEGLARGYLGRGDLTAAAFIPNPFSGHGARLYRTGDLVRRRRNGAIEFLGRIDHQVKLRGFRIELGEIEAVLGAQPGVSEAIAWLSGETLVAAYTTATPQDEVDLRARLAERLPAYMVPAQLLPREAMPRTPNGKVDRKALAREAKPAPTSMPASPPRNPIEALVVELFAEVLGREGLGVEADFFACGGHSLAAARLVGRLHALTGVALPVKALFETPRAEQIAARLGAARRAAAEPSLLRGEDAPYPLSFTQRRMWFLDQLERGSAHYNLHAALRLEGELDREALRTAWEQVQQRHEALRSIFRERNGEPYVALAEETQPLGERTLAPAALETALTAEKGHVFRLDRQAPVRLVLYRLGKGHHVLSLTLHHIIGDEWSMHLLFEAMAAAYRGETLPEPSLRYGDYARWQQRWPASESGKAQLAYWCERLRGLPERIEFATPSPRAELTGHAGGQVDIQLAPQLSRDLRELGGGHGATPFMTLLAGFQVLLARYSHGRDLAVGIPIANRDRPQTQDLIGFLANTLVMRARLEGEPTYLDLLAQTRADALDAYAHPDLPFDTLVETLQPQRQEGLSPLFQVMFIYQNAAPRLPQLPGLTVTTPGGEETVARYELSLTVAETADGFRARLVYHRDRFTAAAAERMAQHLVRLLEAVVADPQRSVFAHDLLTEAERMQMLQEWNESPELVPPFLLAHRWIEAQARQLPDQVAVRALAPPERTLTYVELDRHANRYAHFLLARGLQPEQAVALHMARDIELVAAILGVLKAGGVFLYLNPELPEERRELLQQNCAVTLGPEPPELEGPETKPELTVEPDQLAYLIFTSGSTGIPKGVAAHHRGLCHLTAMDGALLELAPGMRGLHGLSFSFDGGVGQLFLMLCHGMEMVLAERPTADVALLEKYRIQHLGTATPMWAAQPRKPLPHLKTLILAADVLPDELARYWAEGRALYNGYGPSEITVCSSTTRYRPEEGRPHLGRAGNHVTYYLLDPHFLPVPIGLAGEIVIGGAGVTRGYLNQPAATAAAFVPDPFATEPGARCYKSGDLGRWRAEGVLDFLGRIDFQAKVRGHRIDPREVENVLRRHEELDEVLVEARNHPHRSGEKRLIAWFTARGPLEAEALRQLARAQLPEYAVPEALIALDAFPLNLSGKIDRRALPEPEAASRPVYVAPASPQEDLIAAIWSEILGVPEIGRNDHFFELGGHSLLATRVASRLREAFGVDLPLKALFEAPTLAALAEAVNFASGEAAVARVITAAPREEQPPLSFQQQRLWFLHLLEGHNVSYNLPLALTLSGPTSALWLDRALTEICARHEVLRTRFVERDGKPAQQIDPPADQVLTVIDLSGLETHRQAIIDADARKPFEVEGGSLCRMSLLRTSTEDADLLIAMHHGIGDAWSISRMVSELAPLYRAGAEGRPLGEVLEPVALQYADYAHWQRAWMASPSYAHQLTYWKQQLAGIPTLLELPTDRPRPPVRTTAGRALSFEVELVVRDRFEAHCAAVGATSFMGLIALYAVLLARYSGQNDVVIGTPIAGRNRREIEEVMGLFVNTLALRLKLGEALDFRGLLAQARRVLLEAYAYQDLPFERLVDELQPERSLNHTPIFQVMFVMQNTPGTPPQMPGIAVSQTGAASTSAKFDMNLLLSASKTGLLGVLEYNTDLFDSATMHRFAAHYRHLLRAVGEAPERRLDDLEFLEPAERQAMLIEWNLNPQSMPHGPLLHDGFVAQAVRAPERPALSCGDRLVSYGELWAWSSRIAGQLPHYGVRPGMHVGVCLERGPLMIAAVLAVLQAGAAYAPIDADYPEARVRDILEDSEAPLILTSAALAESMLVLAERALFVDQLPEREPAALPERVDDILPAYVIFTSGSTGRPKGVRVQHHGAVNLIEWVNRTFAVGTEDRLLFVTSLCFDLSVYDIFGMLAAGGCIEIATRDDVRDPQRLVELLQQRPITFWDSAPAALNQLTPFLPEQGCGNPRLRLVFLSGDWIPLPLAPALQTAFPNVEVVSLGGATEAIIWSNFHRIGTIEPHWKSIPYGRPISNARYYVLDARMRPAPLGVPGDLYIGGPVLAMGYANRCDLTAERFVPDPFSELGERLYATGDRARWCQDGFLEFLGRLDHQVKIRGFRIELGEIEAALAEAPGVREAVVLALPAPGSKISGPGANLRLVAFAIAKAEALSSAKAFLSERLPDYMVPALLIAVEQWPRTANGKLDRKALAELAAHRQSPVTEHRAMTPAEATLAEIWCEVLGLDAVGPDDNFFELGGDSILTIQVIAGARKRGLALTARAIMEGQTVATCARLATPLAVAERVDVPLAGSAPPAPVLRWLLAHHAGLPRRFNLSAVLRLPADVEVASLASAVADLQVTYDALRLRWDGASLVFAAPKEARPLFFSHEVEEIDEAGFAELAELHQAAIDPYEGDIARFVLVQAREEARLLVVIHHIACDGVSLRVLLETLGERYARRLAGDAGESVVVDASYLGWLQSREAAREEARSQTKHWGRVVASAPRLPLGDVFAPFPACEAMHHDLVLAPELSAALIGEAHAAFHTRPLDLLLAALVRTFQDWSGHPRLLLDLEGHGRGEEAFARTPGWFTAIYPVLLDAGADGSPERVIVRVKEQLRATPGDGSGYGLLRYAEDSALQGGDAEVLFNYHGRLDRALAEEGPFTPALESSGNDHGDEVMLSHALAINAAISDGQLRARWSYHSRFLSEDVVAALAEGFATHLAALSDACVKREQSLHTAADFPLASLDQLVFERALPVERVVDLYPLSPMQAGMLYHALFDESLAYFEQLIVTIEGPLDIGRFREAWVETARHNPVLCTAFFWEGLSEPLQAVLAEVVLPFEVVALDEAEVDAFLEADRARGFVLNQAPLARITWLQTGPNVGRFVFSYHHILMDGWSLPILFREVFARYAGKPPEARPRPFRDYIAWLAQHPNDEAESFWRGQLAHWDGASSLCEALGTNRPELGDDSRELNLFLDEALSARLDALAREQHLTLNVLVQGAWSLLSARCLDVDRVVFGATVAGRPPELDGVVDMVGLFINTTPVMVHLPPDLGLIPWLRQLHGDQVARDLHAFTPLADIQRWLGLARDQELFEALVVFENYPVDRALADAAEGPLATALESFERINYPLGLTALPGKRLKFRLSYQPARLDEAGAGRLLGFLEHLLREMVDHLEASLDHFRLVDEVALEARLQTWNRVGELSPPTPVRQLFAAQVAAQPHEPALVFPVQAEQDVRLAWDYAALARRARQFAWSLRRRGIGPDDRVAILLPRSADLIAAVLGVLSAGAAYVPLDAAYPASRLAFMLADSRAELVITCRELSALLPDATPLFCDGLDEEVPDGFPNAGPAGLGYVIYTSGSTGQPKGVAMGEQALANLIRWQLRTMPGRWKTAQFSAFSFDVSFQELFATLGGGGCLVLLSESCRRDGEVLLPLLAEEGVERLFLPFAALSMLAEAAERGAPVPRSLKHVVTAGEQLLIQPPIARFFQMIPECLLHNQYGPSETHVVTAHTLKGAVADWPLRVPIGTPVDGIRALILDRRGRPVPVGVPGELVIAGAGVARGYLDRPAASAVRFAPVQLAGSLADARAYRTGDLARFEEDGAIMFLGRVDHQVKIRGFRVEPGEIEARLAAHPAVAGAVVVAHDGRLVAYLTCREGMDRDSDSVKQALAESLPEHMVPALLMWLDAFPLTPSGKIDRRNLPEPQAARDAVAFVPPRNDTEGLLAGIFARLLLLDRVGIHDNFFDLGGDSMLAVRFISGVAAAGFKLKTSLFLAHPTIAEVTEFLEPLDGHHLVGATGELPMTPNQKWYVESFDPENHTWGASYLIDLPPGANADYLRKALELLIERFDALRLRLIKKPDGSWSHHIIDVGEPLPLDEYDLSDLSFEEQVARIRALDSGEAPRHDFMAGPVIWFSVIRMGAGKADRLLARIHHGVFDAFSLDILMEEVIGMYTRQLEGKGPKPPRVSGSYAAFLRAIGEYGSSASLRAEMRYWLDPTRLRHYSMPTDFQGGKHLVGNSDTIQQHLDADLGERIVERVAAMPELRINDFLLYGLARAYAEWSGEPYLRLDVEHNGRSSFVADLDLSRMVGPTTVKYPLLLPLYAGAAPREAFFAVRDALRGVPGDGLGYGMLRYLWPETEVREMLSSVPAPQIFFNNLGVYRQKQEQEVSGAEPIQLHVATDAYDHHPVTYDLLLNCSILNNQLHLSWMYSKAIHKTETIQGLAYRFVSSIEALLADLNN